MDPNTAPASAPTNPPSAPQSSGQGAPPAGGGRGGDEFQGMSREEVIGRYRNLQQQHSETQKGFNTLSDVFRRFSFMFDVQDDSIGLNGDAILQYARDRGLLDAQNPGQNTPANGASRGAAQSANAREGQRFGNPSASPTENNATFLERLEAGGEGVFEDMVSRAVEKAIQDKVTPHLTEFWKDRGERWVDSISRKYPDFEKYRGDAFKFAQQTGFQIRSMDDMERAYKAAKAFAGGYVDKSEHDALQTELMQARQVFNPTAGGMAYDTVRKALDPEADPRDLLGLNAQPQGPDADTVGLLFGKQGLAP